MHNPLSGKFWTLIGIKTVVMGYAQWAGALPVPPLALPGVTPTTLHPTGLQAETLLPTVPSHRLHQEIHQL